MSNLDKKYSIRLDLINNIQNENMKFSLSDNETSDFYIEITKSMKKIDLTNKTVRLYVVKPNKNVIYTEITLYTEDNKANVFYCDLPNNFKNVKGSYYAQILIEDIITGEKVVTPSKFSYTVESDIISEASGVVDTEENKNILDSILSDLTDLKANKIEIDDTTASSTTIYSSNKIESIKEELSSQISAIGGGSSGEGMTSEQTRQLSVAYEHSQSTHAPSNAEANVQVDWNETNTTSDSYIKNKPTNLATIDDIPAVPTKTSQLTNDSGYITNIPDEYITETELNAKGYATTSQIPTVPTNVSEFTNDAHYASETFVNNKIAEAQIGVTTISRLTIIDNVIYLKDNEGNIFGTGVEITGTNAGSSQQDTTFGNILSSTLEWNVLGDSITYGYGVSDGKQYHQLLKSKYNITAVNNYGINSSEIASGGSGGNPMCVRYADMSSTADLITVFGGVNDYLHNITIGTIYDDETTTFYGALNVLTQGLKNKFQDKKIIFFTPMYCKHGAFSTNPNGTNSLGNKLSDYVTAIRLVCNKENIKIIDLYSIDRYNANTRYSKYFSDGLHPNEQGHADFADKITTAVPSYVTNAIKLKSISLEQDTFSLYVGDTCQLDTILNPINTTNKTITFTSDNNNVLVDSNGLITASNSGNSIITISSGDGDIHTTCSININEVVKTFLYNNGDQCESTTGGYTTSMITFNTSDFKIAHSSASKIETVNTFTMNKGDKTGTLSIGNYFGNYTISEWYIIRA